MLVGLYSKDGSLSIVKPLPMLADQLDLEQITLKRILEGDYKMPRGYTITTVPNSTPYRMEETGLHELKKQLTSIRNAEEAGKKGRK